MSKPNYIWSNLWGCLLDTTASASGPEYGRAVTTVGVINLAAKRGAPHPTKGK